MNKVVKIALASTVSMFLLSGCGGSNTQTAEDTISGHAELTLQSHTNSKKLREAISIAGEKEGLKMTPFKDNSFIVERIDGDDSASATVTFSRDKVVIIPETGDIDADDLLEAIEKELNAESEH